MNDIRLYENIAELSEQFPLKLRRYRTRQLYLHWHEHIELLHLLDGEGTFVVNGETVTAHAGETVAVNSNSLHTFRADEEMDYLCLIANPAMPALAGCGNVLLRSVIPEDREVHARFEAMYRAYRAQGAAARMEMLGEAYLLFAHLVTHYAAALLTPEAYGARLAQMEKTTALLAHIHENYQKPITASALAKANYISESHLCRSFKSAVGMPLTQYVNRLRVEKASVLLRGTDEDISAIARRVGIEDLGYFDRLFRRFAGVSPGAYRRAADKAK
jgi:ectoine synthase